MSDDTIEEHWETHVTKFFPQCPLCGSKSLEFDIEYGSVRDYVYCLGCNAKWEIDWKGEDFKIEYVILLEVGDTEKHELKNRKQSPEFWRRMALKTGEDPRIARAKKMIQEKRRLIKVRCEYCGVLFDGTLDVCPHCGGKR